MNRWKGLLILNVLAPKLHWAVYLTLKAPITTADDNTFIYLLYFQRKQVLTFHMNRLLDKTSLAISCESSAWQTIHMKCQDLFSLKIQKKNKKKKNNNNNKKTKKQNKTKIECRLLQILLGALRVIICTRTSIDCCLMCLILIMLISKKCSPWSKCSF